MQVCSACGTDEALRDYAKNPLPLSEWHEAKAKRNEASGENFTFEQEDQIDSVYGVIRELLEVMTPSNPFLNDVAFVGPFADMVSEYLQAHNQEVHFPEQITTDDDTTYVEPTVAICRECQCETSTVKGGATRRHVVNKGSNEQFFVCPSCLERLARHGEVVQCGSCGEYLTRENLLPSQSDPEQMTTCPCCFQSWCD